MWIIKISIMYKFLLLSVLGLLVLASSAHPRLPENPISFGPYKEKENNSSNPGREGNQSRGLWILTAKISQSSTLQLDTLISIDAGNLKWTQERHVSLKTVTRGEVTAVFENQAENPAREFQYDTDSGDPGTITVSGDGMHTSHSSYEEIIGGKLVDANISDINVSGSAYPGATIMFYYSPDSKNISVGITINAKGTDKRRRFHDEWKDSSSELDKYGLSCSGGCDMSDGRNCNITKTSSGYQATWRETENRQRHTANGTEFITSEKTLELTIKPYKPTDKPEVTLYGCSELCVGEKSEIIASGKPAGGKFRFWVEPGNLMKVEPDGESSSILTGSTPGRGMLYVEYTSPEGKTNTKSQPASCVKIESYNGGQEIPQIGLFDIDGNKKSGKLTIPYSSMPDEAQELVDFVSGNPTVFTATATAKNIDLQGIKPGKASLEAKDNCGNTTGPTVEVEVVNCDKETVEALEKMRKAAIEILQDKAEKLQEVAGSEEFEEARDEIVESTVELLAKAGLTILGSGETHGAVETAIEIAEAGESYSELIASATNAEFAERSATTILKALGTHVTKAVVGAIGVHEAAKKFGDNLGQIILHESELKDANESWDKANRDLQRIERIQQTCKGDKTEPEKQEKPKADQTPQPTKPTPPKEPKPKTDTPPAKEQPVEEPTPPGPGEEEPPVSPPPPTTEPRQVGLPYSPEDCGCGKTKSIIVSTKGISDIMAGARNLGDCVDRFDKTSAADYLKALNELSELTKSLEARASDKPELFIKQAKEAKPKLDSLIKRIKEYDKAGKAFMGEFEKCPESVKSGMEVLESAITVTIDSIKTKYW